MKSSSVWECVCGRHIGNTHMHITNSLYRSILVWTDHHDHRSLSIVTRTHIHKQTIFGQPPIWIFKMHFIPFNATSVCFYLFLPITIDMDDAAADFYKKMLISVRSSLGRKHLYRNNCYIKPLYRWSFKKKLFPNVKNDRKLRFSFTLNGNSFLNRFWSFEHTGD